MNRKYLRKRRVRAKITGTAERPRLSVSASILHVRAQLIDDTEGKTIVSASDLKNSEKMTKVKKAEMVGSEIARLAKEAKIKSVVFDRGANLYHGRVKALAEAARKSGLEF